MRALIVSAKNQYGVVSHFLDGISADLTLLHYTVDTLVLPQSGGNINEQLATLSPIEDYAFILSFNGVGLGNLGEGYNSLTYAQNKPVYVFCVDHPMHVIPRFYGHPVTVLCVDKEHIEFMTVCGMKSHYFPHAVSQSLQNEYKTVPAEDKSDEVLLPISYLNKQKLREQLQPVWRQIGQAVEACENVTEFLRTIGVMRSHSSPVRTLVDENIRRISVLVDKYLRACQRENCLKACEKNGQKLTVIGRGVEHYRTISASHHYEESLDFESLLKRCATSAYVLHHSPGFNNGLHERVVFPLAVGTPVITWNTPHINTEFKDKGVFSLGAPIPRCTDDLYESERGSARIHILQNHTWMVNLSSVLNL